MTEASKTAKAAPETNASETNASEANSSEVTGAQQATPQSGSGQQVRKVNWNDKEMDTTFANVVNVLNTREEFMMLFGTNQTWNAVDAEELNVRLDNRIVLTPHATKRLLALLANRMSDYEKRFGKVEI